MSAHLLLVHALSPIHAGTGHSPGAIDLPIARDTSTGFPILPGSGIKGALRAAYSLSPGGPKVTEVFGPETANASDHAGGLWVGDANLLCLPVRSVAGTFAWVTSPFLLGRFFRDARETALIPPGSPPPVASVGACTVTSSSSLPVGAKVYFEDLDFQSSTGGALDPLADWLATRLFTEEHWRQSFKTRLCVVHDTVMSYLSTHAMDVVTRVRLENDTKTVAKGALWTEESLPTESLLAALVVAAPNKKTAPLSGLQSALQSFDGKTLPFGGDVTVGRGRCQLRVVTGGAR